MDEDLDAKLKELEKVHEAIKNLKSSADDKTEQEKAMAAADKILKERKANETKTVINKTKINKPADPNAGMMAAMAADAEKRAEERKKRVADANRIKAGFGKLIFSESSFFSDDSTSPNSKPSGTNPLHTIF